jgi:hypothetical protein
MEPVIPVKLRMYRNIGMRFGQLGDSWVAVDGFKSGSEVEGLGSSMNVVCGNEMGELSKPSPVHVISFNRQ